MFEISDTQKIGVGLAGFGIFFLFLGMLLLFDKSLLALGNILFIAGLAAVIGRERTFRFFFQRHKIKGTISFFGGIIIVLCGWPMVGMLFEAYGFFLLFSGFFPVAINFLRRVPFLGTILNMPGISKIAETSERWHYCYELPNKLDTLALKVFLLSGMFAYPTLPRTISLKPVHR